MQKVTNEQLPRPTKNATSFEKTILGRRKQGSTQRSFHSLSSYEQTEREKFAQEYAKLTKQFRAILARSSQKGNIFRQNNASNLVKRFKIDANHRQRRAITEGMEQTKYHLKDEDYQNQKDDTSALKNKSRLARLQDLYNNRLHNEIVETASKLQRNKKQSIASIANLSPQQKTQPFIISPIKKVTQQPNQIQRSADKQIFIHLQKEKNQKINLKFSKIPETLAHFHNIFKIYELLGDYKNDYSNLIKNIKKYVMNYNGADISKLQELLKIPRDRERLKIFLCLEKVSILGILDAMVKQNQLGVKNESKVILETIFGVYKSIINYILEQNNQRDKPQLQQSSLESLQLCEQMLQSLGIQNRKDLESTSEYLFKKIQSLFRSNLELFHKIKQLLTTLTNVDINNSEMNIKISPNPKNSPTFNININRFFYFLLSQYAHWLNSASSIQILKIHKNMLDFFATSPAPHLTFAPPPGKITVVIQLQGVLALVKSNNQQHQKLTFRMRPYALQFLEQMYQKVQIILMTTLMPQNLPSPEINVKTNKISKNKQDPVQKMLSLSSFILYKYHYVRYHGLLVKDMNRMGRKPQNLILVDGISYPSIPPIDMIRNQKANTEYLISQRNSSLNEQSLIPISTWRGSPQDSQLSYLKQILLNIIEEQPQDVREIIKKLKKFEKNHKIQERQDSQFLQPTHSLEQQMNHVGDIEIQKQYAHEAKQGQVQNIIDAVDDGYLNKLEANSTNKK